MKKSIVYISFNHCCKYWVGNKVQSIEELNYKGNYWVSRLKKFYSKYIILYIYFIFSLDIHVLVSFYNFVVFN